MNSERLQNDHYCKSQTKTGKPCRAAATEGGLCYFHANPKKAAELGRIGGRENRFRTTEMDPLPSPDSAAKISEILDRIISELYGGELRPRVADTLGRLLNVRLRAIQVTDLERRLRELEQSIGAERSGDNSAISKLQQRLETFGEEVTQGTPREDSGDERSRTDN